MKRWSLFTVILGIYTLIFAVSVNILYTFAEIQSIQHGKMYRNFMFLDEWMNKKRSDPNKIVRTLEQMNYRKVAIYGAGYLGYQLYRELQDSPVKVAYMIDNYRTESGLPVPVYALRNVKEKVDAVIVSVPYEGKKMEENIREQTGLNTILLEELI